MKRLITIFMYTIVIGVLIMANANIPAVDKSIPGELEAATLGLGCFWGSEAAFGGVRGIYRTSVGYAGGTKVNPSYYSLGDHTEVVQVWFNPLEISYREVLEIFWNAHNAFSRNSYRQYMSLILYHNETQKTVAEEFVADKNERMQATASTEISAFREFYRAEDYHLKFYLQQNRSVLQDLSRYYDDIFSLDDSTAAARLNAFLAGRGDPSLLSEEIEDYGLTQRTAEEVKRRLNVR